MDKLYAQFEAQMRKIADVEYAIGVLSWDKEVYMPKKGSAFRGQQVATLSGIAHELAISESLGETLHKLDASRDSLTEAQSRNVELTLKDYKRAKKYTKEFVMRGSNLVSNAYRTWLEAREADDYKIYEPALNDLIQYKREEAELLGYSAHPYDALLDIYEPDSTVAELDALFAQVQTVLLDISQKIRQQPNVSAAVFSQRFDKDAQWNFGIDLLKLMGYDFDAGRQDISPHPFTINFNSEDVRVTTRVDEMNLANMTWSCIHEGGHALYEQGLPSEQYGLPLGRAISLGIHESQSRLWENNVGRSRSFWKGQLTLARKHFPSQFDGVSVDAFYKAMNRLEPNLIRTEADEVHYHFHVMIRYEIEKQIMEKSVEAKHLSELWNDMYKRYLGLRPNSANDGILQDIHWAHGSIGYFPTYSLGSFYAAQFYHCAKSEIKGLDSKLEAGDMTTLLTWLRTRIHQYGKLYSAKTLCEKVTGEALNFSYFEKYVKEKYGDIYDVIL